MSISQCHNSIVDPVNCSRNCLPLQQRHYTKKRVVVTYRLSVIPLQKYLRSLRSLYSPTGIRKWGFSWLTGVDAPVGDGLSISTVPVLVRIVKLLLALETCCGYSSIIINNFLVMWPLINITDIISVHGHYVLVIINWVMWSSSYLKVKSLSTPVRRKRT